MVVIWGNPTAKKTFVMWGCKGEIKLLLSGNYSITIIDLAHGDYDKTILEIPHNSKKD